MKATVIEVFIDALSGQQYAIGDVIDVSDSARLALMKEKKLVEVEEELVEVETDKPKKPTKTSKKKKDV